MIGICSCSKTSFPCPSPTAHIPSFTQSKFRIKVGESVKYTYTGEDLIDKDDFFVEWEFNGGIPATSRDTSVTVVYSTVGSYKVTCRVITRCINNDMPFITKDPAIVVTP